MNIRPMNINDLPEVIDIFSKYQLNADRVKKHIGNFMKKIGHFMFNPDMNACVVAEKQDNVVGYIVAGAFLEDEINKCPYQDSHEWVNLNFMAVNKELAPKGTGSKLLEYFYQYCSSKGFKSIHVGTWGNTQNFYTKNGFQVTTVYLRKDLAE